jgi:hypothetical protein
VGGMGGQGGGVEPSRGPLGRRALDRVRDTLLAPPPGLAGLTAAQQRTMARLLNKALAP